MNSFNRFLIFILLIALLYALHKYQSQTQEIVIPERNKIGYKEEKEKKKQPGKKQLDIDDISISNVSQLSLESDDDILDNYQKDSLLGSLESIDNDTLGFLDDNSCSSQESLNSNVTDQSFFFQ